jgi:hypothetical protein
MNDFLKPPKTKTLLWTLCGILAILVVFGMGIVVGYRRAIFASEFGENYYRNLFGNPFGQPMIGMVAHGPMTMHGVVGSVINVGSSTLDVRDSEGDEESIVIVSGTPIREMGNDISAGDVENGDFVTVIGDPNGDGQIMARFIRVFEASSSLPPAPVIKSQ